MDKFTFQLPVFQAIHFKDFLDKIELPYKIRFEPGGQIAPDLVVYFDMFLNDMDYIRISNHYSYICNCRCLMP